MPDEQEKIEVPSGGQTDVAASGEKAEPAEEPGESAADKAWKTYPKQVQAAITYAGANKYDYGPKFRNIELDYEVESATPVTDDITRIVLSYRPKTKFRGAAGSEYLDIDLNGEVLARRQIRIAKESMPWVLMGIATLSVIAAAVLVPLMLLLEDKGDPLFVAGRTLWIRSGEPRTQPWLTYDSIDTENVVRKWLILPEGEGTEIAWMNVTLINQTSGSVDLAINTEAAQLTTDDDLAVKPIDIFERVVLPAEGQEIDPRQNIPDLPLWGNLVLESNQQVSGFMAFEIPAGSGVKSLRWSATDTANIRY